MSDAPTDRLTLLDEIALALLPHLQHLLPTDKLDTADAQQLFAAAYDHARTFLRVRRGQDQGRGLTDPWASWRDLAARFLLSQNWRRNTTTNYGTWSPPWDTPSYYDLGDAVDTATDRADRMAGCVACLRTTDRMLRTPLPFHTCGVVANPAPAPGSCPNADGGTGAGDHTMQIRFAGEMKVVDCATCRALSPDSD